jgi:hypothetical protein
LPVDWPVSFYDAAGSLAPPEQPDQNSGKRLGAFRTRRRTPPVTANGGKTEHRHAMPSGREPNAIDNIFLWLATRVDAGYFEST